MMSKTLLVILLEVFLLVAHLNKIDIFIDNSLERFTSLFAAAGHPNCVFEDKFYGFTKNY